MVISCCTNLQALSLQKNTELPFTIENFSGNVIMGSQAAMYVFY
jgi:hypothetical protein